MPLPSGWPKVRPPDVVVVLGVGGSQATPRNVVGHIHNTVTVGTTIQRDATCVRVATHNLIRRRHTIRIALAISVGGLENLELNIFELHRRGWACVQLQPQDAGRVALAGIVVDDFGSQAAVYFERETRSLADQVVLMPLFELEPRRALGLGYFGVRGFATFVKHRALPAPGEIVSAVFVVEAHRANPC